MTYYKTYFLILLFPIIIATASQSLVFNGFHWVQLGFVLFLLLASIVEEIVFRYFIPKVFGRGDITVILFSIIFSLAHATNTGFGVLSFINTFIISIMLYQVRFSLGLKYAVLFHFSWNAILSILLGMTVSGLDLASVARTNLGYTDYNSIFSSHLDIQISYGIEGSIYLTIITLALMFPYITHRFYRFYRKRCSL